MSNYVGGLQEYSHYRALALLETWQESLGAMYKGWRGVALHYWCIITNERFSFFGIMLG